MHPGAVTSGLLLLLTAAVDSYREVCGVVGRPITLPCTYDVSPGIANVCWGRGQCPYFKCSGQLIWTDGYRVTYQRNSRYRLKGKIPEGNVSLTIENALQSDSGLYCCRVEILGLFNDQLTTFTLQVRPEIPTRPTITTLSIQAPLSTRVSTATRPTPAHTQTPKPISTVPSLPQTTEEGIGTPSYTPMDYNDTVTSSNEPGNNHTEAIPTQKPPMTTTKHFITAIPIAVLVLLFLGSAVAVAKYMQIKRRMCSLRLVSFHVSKIRALESAVEQQPQAEDNIYVVEDSIYGTE
ncbi:hepatitis A virus cellular receptor 1 homolog [Nannospalax galili]|uniref:hepatitis A virus cellular receptor 1 homolog n=1 Tax=Nannospalax galili TaxID=1026970 RepID=UPI00111C2B5D|nr:hepatitis A virus cellular receptor 1 homolog [Nannospalax galili]